MTEDSASLGSNPSSPAPQNPTKYGFLSPGQSGQERPEGEPAPHKSRHSGHIYFIQSLRQKAIKIGYTRDLSFRLGTLQTGNPDKLRAIDAFRGSRALETKLHRRFRSYRITNEWFRDCRAIWDFLEDLEDIMVAIFVEMKCSGQLPDFSIKKYPTIWNDLDIPEEMVLACGRK